MRRLNAASRASAVALLLVIASGLVGHAAAGAATQAPTAADPVGAYGDAVPLGGPAGLGAPVVGMAATADGGGYWLVASDGGVFAYGDALFHGSAAGTPAGYDVVGLAPTPDGGGYWLVGSDGVVTNFGDAAALGSIGSIGVVLNQPVVGMAATPDGGGYWLAAADGGVFAFGDARFYGSEGATPLNAPVVGIAATPDGGGYWLAAADGGVFAFGDARFYGSEAATPLDVPIVGMAATPSGRGYWLVAGDGGVFAFGDAGFDGSAVAAAPGHPVAGVAATHDGGGYWIPTSVVGPVPVPSVPQVIADCGNPAVRPNTIVLACADYGSILEGIAWSSWTATAAHGAGTYRYNTCTPDCANGTFESAPATITVRAPVSTAAGVEFTTVTWTFTNPGAPGGSTTYTEDVATSG
jgi:hypothetical protein